MVEARQTGGLTTPPPSRGSPVHSGRRPPCTSLVAGRMLSSSLLLIPALLAEHRPKSSGRRSSPRSEPFNYLTKNNKNGGYRAYRTCNKHHPCVFGCIKLDFR